MAIINDLIRQIEDLPLKERIKQEIDYINKGRKFGLVFEQHAPEATPIYEMAIKKGSIVSLKGKEIIDIWIVMDIRNDEAICYNSLTDGISQFKLKDLVVIAQFGDTIYPTLIPIDKVKNSNDLLWHILIESDNYHALQLLEYLYPKQVDCIYIDPPYNTGARDWKYNNDYVDSADNWRHSKWLSMMQKRLKIAKRLLRDDGVIITTIDDNEYAHLWMLLNDVFPDRKHISISIQHNPGGTQGDKFSVTHEYAIYSITDKSNIFRKKHIGGDFYNLRRWGSTSGRYEGATCFYPVLLDYKNNIIGFGQVVDKDFHPESQTIYRKDGMIEVWPIDKNGIEKKWRYGRDTVEAVQDRMFVEKNKDRLEIFLRRESEPPKTIWTDPLYNAEVHGTTLIKKIIDNTFSYPKSLYAVKDSIAFATLGKKEALILDFFAGSGTTLNAVNLLNYEDNGKRRCIMVTNNEVSEEVAKKLKNRGVINGDVEWEAEGICKSVTWPRTKNSIIGKKLNGLKLEGEYYTSLQVQKEKTRKFFQISFTDVALLNSVKNKKQLVSLLGKDKLPQSLVKNDSKYIISEKYAASILFDELVYEEWLNEMNGKNNILEFYIVTSKVSRFNEIKKKIEETLEPVMILEEIRKDMAEGFEANVEYFKLDFLDKNNIELGQQFKEILPILWLKAGAIGERPEIGANDTIPTMLVCEKNNFAVLIEESLFSEFKKKIDLSGRIDHIFIVTNSEEAFREMASQINYKYITQLYRDYIDNFVINNRRI